MIKWLTNSGAVIQVKVNPCHWRWLPWSDTSTDVWDGPRVRTVAVGWLAVTVRLWADDGSW